MQQKYLLHHLVHIFWPLKLGILKYSNVQSLKTLIPKTWKTTRHSYSVPSHIWSYSVSGPVLMEQARVSHEEIKVKNVLTGKVGYIYWRVDKKLASRVESLTTQKCGCCIVLPTRQLTCSDDTIPCLCICVHYIQLYLTPNMAPTEQKCIMMIHIKPVFISQNRDFLKVIFFYHWVNNITINTNSILFSMLRIHNHVQGFFIY